MHASKTLLLAMELLGLFLEPNLCHLTVPFQVLGLKGIRVLPSL
jgi:hypothetical protein